MSLVISVAQSLLVILPQSCIATNICMFLTALWAETLGESQTA